MTLAIISDIHGNLPALEAVIDDIERTGVDEIIVNGDMVGRGPQGTAVVDRIEALGWACVGGNHEEYLLSFVHRDVPATWWQTEEWAASRWMAAELSASAVDFISDLPFHTRRGDVHIVHGTMQSNRLGLGSWTSDEDLEAQLDEADARVLVCAHTHRAMVRQVGARTVVNAGAVGLPFNGDPRAQYAVLDGDEVHLRKVEYDREATLHAYASTGFLEAGGVTATLLLEELTHARPFLVPFLKWCGVQDFEPGPDYVPPFLEWHEPFAPLSLLYEKMSRLQAAQEDR